MRSADYIVDVGPGAGVHGGEIVAAGSVKDICKAKRSITGDYLSGRKRIAVPQTRRTGNGNLPDRERCPGEQPAQHRRPVPAGRVHLRDRHFRFRQVQPDQ